MSRRGLLGLLALSGLLLLLLFAAFPRPAPDAPPAAAEPARRELDEAAEEVRAVSTLIQGLERKISDQDARTRELRDGMAQLRRRLEQLDQRPASAPTPAAAPAPAAADAGDGAFDLEALVNLPGRTDAGTPAPASPDRSLVWVEPLRPDDASGLPIAVPAAADDAAAAPGPRFVIPPSVLSGRSLTALVGRVPRGGAVQDPWPFLAVSGRDNLSANNARLPELQGVLWRGVVHGDATLECASASIRSLVYVFPDGVFHAANAPGGEGFGYLADRAGNPCLAGTLHSTAAEDLHRGLLAGMVAGAGGAFAQEQLATRATAAGETTRVEGDAFRYLLGQTVQGAAGSYAELLAEASSDSWEAVVVPAGQEVDLHITAAIPVVHDPAQRVRADRASAPAAVPGGLD